MQYHLTKHEIFEENEARFFIAEVMLAIEYIHSLHVIYRDLKPENILISADGHIKLADFGLAREGMNKKGAKAMSFCGSPAYLPPEMLSDSGVGKPGDIYQMGAVLYEMLVGTPPFYTENIQKLYKNIQKEKLQLPPVLSPDACDLLTRMLHKKPNHRITIVQMRQHSFFKDIDWQKLARKELKPPVYLCMEDDGPCEADQLKEVDDEEAFLNFKGKDEAAADAGAADQAFADEDYAENNQKLNRVKQFTFIQDARPGQ